MRTFLDVDRLCTETDFSIRPFDAITFSLADLWP